MKRVVATFSPLIVLFSILSVRADDIVGVQPAALDQPRIYVNVRRSGSSSPLTVKADNQSQAAIEAFLDTGASGIALAEQTSSALGVKKQTLDQGGEAQYEDVGVGGSEKFATWPLARQTSGCMMIDASRPTMSSRWCTIVLHHSFIKLRFSSTPSGP